MTFRSIETEKGRQGKKIQHKVRVTARLWQGSVKKFKNLKILLSVLAMLLKQQFIVDYRFSKPCKEEE